MVQFPVDVFVKVMTSFKSGATGVKKKLAIGLVGGVKIILESVSEQLEVKSNTMRV